jgi:TPR repeat protein
MCKCGRGVCQDHSQAMSFYLNAVNQGHNPAQDNIGDLYGNGHGVPQDYCQAMDWYLKSVQQGHARDQCSIGYLYDRGPSVVQDSSLTMEWYRKTVNRGNDTAHFLNGCLNGEGSVNQKGARTKRSFYTGESFAIGERGAAAFYKLSGRDIVNIISKRALLFQRCNTIISLHCG